MPELVVHFSRPTDMHSAPETQPSLLLRLRDSQDAEAWARFVEIYAHVVRRRGLQEADASDLTQDVLTSVTSAVGSFEYDRRRGTFRRWLFTIVQNRLRDHWRSRQRQAQASGNTAFQEILLEQPAEQNDEEKAWERDYQQRLLQCTSQQVRGDFQDGTWQAFWRTAVQGKPGKNVARELDMTVAAVYLAKRCVLTRIKEQIRLLEEP